MSTIDALVPTAHGTTVIDRGGMPVLTTAALKARVEAVLEAIANVLEEGKDYGKIPGTDKPTLYKPGAEKLCMMFQLASSKPHFEDLSTADEIRYRVAVPIEAPDGRIIAVGVGEASTNEEKYRWRFAVHEKEWDSTAAHLRRIKYKRDGSETKQVRTSPADLANTVLKMSHKRGFIHGTLLATAASSVFNQDLEDFTKELQESLISADETTKTEAKQPQRKSANGGTAQPKTLPADAKIATGVISKIYDDKKPFAILLKGSQTRYTTFDEAVLRDAKQFVDTDHTVKLAYTETQKDGRTFTNAVGVSIADAEPAKTAPATAPVQQPLTAGDIFGGAGREPGEDG